MSQHPKPTPFCRMSALRHAALLTIVFIVIMLATGTLAPTELSVRFANITDEIADDGFDSGPDTLRFLPNGSKSSDLVLSRLRSGL
ncbi:MAG: hypothetical protein ACI9C3_003231 [Yoonia sp.]